MCPIDLEVSAPNWPEYYQAAYRLLEQSIIPTQLRIWIHPLDFVTSETLANGSIKIEFRAPNEFSANWVRDHYKQLIEDAFTQVFGVTHEVKFGSASDGVSVNPTPHQEDVVQPSLMGFTNEMQSVDPQKRDLGKRVSPKNPNVPVSVGVTSNHSQNELSGPEPVSTLPTVSTTPRQTQPEAQLNSQYTFDTFVVGSSNQFAHASAVAVADHPAAQFNPLFIYSRPGLGKTHLLHAIGNRIRASNPHARIGYLSAERFVNEVIECLQNRRMAQFRTKYRDSYDVLMIDDIQFIAGKVTTEEEFFHTFNTLHSAKKQIVITSDRPPQEIEKLEERMRTRFEWGMVVDIQPPDIETRIAILKSKAEREDIYLPDEVATYLATHVKTNIRVLEGHLVKLQMQASFTGSEISLDMAKQQLKAMVPDEGPKYTVEMIQTAVARHYQIRAQEFKTPTRAQRIALPRQVAMYLIRRYTGLGYAEIGTYFGDRDRTTVMHACEKIEESLELTPDLKRAIEGIQTLL